MDSLSLPSAMVVMVGLLGAARLSTGEERNCTCPQIGPWPLTQPAGETCFGPGARYRYKCVEGYVRKAGTSDLIKCESKNGALEWSPPNLTCKPDPKLKRPTTQPTRIVQNKNNCTCPEIPQRPATEPPGETCFQINATYRYTCLEGYVRKSGTSDLIRCRLNGSALVWTTPNLQCIPSPMRNATQSPANTVSTTSSSPQTTWSVSSLATVTGETKRVETTTHDPWTQATMMSNQTNQNSTYSTTFKDNTPSPPEARTEIARAAGISASIVIVCALPVIFFILYRRRLKSKALTPQPTEDELMPMNGGTTTVAVSYEVPSVPM